MIMMTTITMTFYTIVIKIRSRENLLGVVHGKMENARDKNNDVRLHRQSPDIRSMRRHQ